MVRAEEQGGGETPHPPVGTGSVQEEQSERGAETKTQVSDGQGGSRACQDRGEGA